ncbi:MAG: YbbR-like domain-containing protein [Candidatus Dormibacteria bacterium]
MTLFSNNWRLKLAALFIASTTWGVVAYAGNPVETREIPRVPIQAGSPPNNWVMISQLPPVTVTVSGLHQSLAAFQPSNLHANIDLAAAHLGPNVVKVVMDNSDPRVAVSMVTPASVEVILDEKDVVTKKVDVRFKNSENNCCVAQRSKATATPDTVKLSGPKSVLAKGVPYVQADLTEARADLSPALDVKLDGIDPRAAPLVTVEPKQVQVFVPVTPVKKRAQAGLNVPFVGQVASGYRITDVKSTPDVLQIEGDPIILAQVSSLDTQPINISGATADIVQTVTVKPPTGVAIIGSTQVTVHISVAKNPVVEPSPSPRPSASPTP